MTCLCDIYSSSWHLTSSVHEHDLGMQRVLVLCAYSLGILTWGGADTVTQEVDQWAQLLFYIHPKVQEPPCTSPSLSNTLIQFVCFN